MIKADQSLRRLQWWFDTLDRRRTLILTTAIILLIVLVDTVTGWRLRFTMFYILPVWIAAWKIGFRSGLAHACASALIGASVNAGYNLSYSLADLPLWMWEIGGRFVPLATIAWLVDAHHRTILRERALARSDALTGALNRRALLEEGSRALAHGQRLGLATGFLYLDLDGFKAVNDRHGHGVGDDLLVKFVETAHHVLRRGDRVGRVGGDEFVLVFVAATVQGVEAAAKRVGGDLRQLVGAWTPPVSFCAGLCLVDPGATDDPLAAIAEADRMLYEAKRARDGAGWLRTVHLSVQPVTPQAA